MQSENTTANQEQVDLFMKELRTATTPMHRQLEANAVSISLMNPTVTVQQYVTYLTLMKEVIRFCEQDIFPAIADVVTDTKQREKLSQITADVSALSTTEIQFTPNSAYAPVTADISLAYALGYMYVIEGSTLGGRIILKHVNGALGVDENRGASFFAGYGAQTGILWKAFLDKFSAYAIENNKQSEIIDGAKDAFASIATYFEAHS